MLGIGVPVHPEVSKGRRQVLKINDILTDFARGSPSVLPFPQGQSVFLSFDITIITTLTSALSF